MKHILAAVLTVALILCMVGCETTADADEEKQFTRHNSLLSITVDRETGVNYIVYIDSSGYSGGGAISPRYNADGTLYVSEVE